MAMKARIDIPLFTKELSYSVSGLVEFETAPEVGDALSFMFPPSGAILPTTGFNGLVAVERRIFQVGDRIRLSSNSPQSWSNRVLNWSH
jgi:hypothetical protein